jgi:hypothetical protein
MYWQGFGFKPRVGFPGAGFVKDRRQEVCSPIGRTMNIVLVRTAGGEYEMKTPSARFCAAMDEHQAEQLAIRAGIAR